jgi:hypothetical protein
LKILITVSWICTIGLAFFAGSYWHKSTSYTEHSSEVEVRSLISSIPQVTTNATQETALSKELTDSVAATEQKQVANQSTLNQVISMFKGVYGQDLGSIASAYNLITNMSEEDLLSDLEYLRAYANDPEYSLTLSLYLDRYASIAPYKALTFALNNITSQQIRLGAISIALSKWAQKDPTLALDWYNGNREELSSRFNPILSGIFANMATKNQDLAIQLLQDYTDDRTELSLAISGITLNLKESADFINLLEKTAYLDSSNAQRSILSAWLRANPEGTLDWFSELPESSNKDKTEELIFGSYINTDASNAADWYMSRATSDQLQSRANKIIGRWSFSNPEDALKWVSRQTDIDAQQATKELLLNAALSDPSLVTNNLHLLTSNKDKADASARIFITLKRESSAKAQMFFEASPYQKEILKFETAILEYGEQQ